MKSAYIEVIEDCNLRCIFCSRGDKEGVGKTADIIELVNKYHKLGYKKFIFTGGEPLLFKDLDRVIAHTAGLGVETAIQTNGILMTKKRAEELKAARLGQIIFSIHSHISKLEDKIMNGERVLEKQLEGLRNALNVGFFTPVTTLIIKQNYRHLPGFFDFMFKEFPEVNHYTLNFVDPIGRSESNRDVVPKLSEIELYLAGALLKLKNSKRTFRVERVPICYMFEFAEYCTELRRLATREFAVVHREKESKSYTDNYFEVEYVRGDACKSCTMKSLCPGVDIDYARIYGTDELYPLFINPKIILAKTGRD